MDTDLNFLHFSIQSTHGCVEHGERGIWQMWIDAAFSSFLPRSLIINRCRIEYYHIIRRQNKETIFLPATNYFFKVQSFGI